MNNNTKTLYQKLKNMDLYFKTADGNKIIINDLDYLNIGDINKANQMLMTVYDTDVINTKPVCMCGLNKGRYLLGVTCPECGTVVTDPLKQRTPIMWMKRLDSMEKFINPTYWVQLKRLLGGKLDYVRWLCDTSYNPPGDIPRHVRHVETLLGGREYNLFTRNIDKVLVYLATLSDYSSNGKQKEISILLNQYVNTKDTVLSNFMPMVNSKLFVMENTSKGKITNLTVSDMIDVVMMWIKNSSTNVTIRKKSNSTAIVLSKLATLYESYFKDFISQKPGIFRKHVFSARSHFTFRAVIIAMAGTHDYDEIHVPWSIGVTAFRPHILNKLIIRKGYSYNAANKLLYRSVNKYSEVIDEILRELIAEAPNGKLYVNMQRNPTLLAGSSQRVRISRFKTDIYDRTVSISPLIAVSMNADSSNNSII